jgi:ribosomal protein S18 acetylase RimI-like enzyme
MDPTPAARLRAFRYPEDYPAARRLWESAGPGIQLRRSDTPEEIQKKLARDPDLFLVAELDGKLVGTVIGGFDGRRGMIYHLAVDASVRERGIGGLLMDEVERRLKEKGCLRSYLLVTTDNQHAMRFYEKRGWSHMDTVFVYGKDL